MSLYSPKCLNVFIRELLKLAGCVRAIAHCCAGTLDFVKWLILAQITGQLDVAQRVRTGYHNCKKRRTRSFSLNLHDNVFSCSARAIPQHGREEFDSRSLKQSSQRNLLPRKLLDF